MINNKMMHFGKSTIFSAIILTTGISAASNNMTILG